MRIVSWQNVLTDHQSHTLKALGAMPGCDLHVVSGDRRIRERKDHGWPSPDTSGLSMEYLKDSGWWPHARSILEDNRNAVHLFNGLWADRRFYLLLMKARRMGLHTGVVMEAWSDVPAGYLQEESGIICRVKSWLRPLVYATAGRAVSCRISALFAISPKAVDQAEAMGVPADRIFPFIYAVPAHYMISASKPGSSSCIRMVYVGSLLKTKGIDTALEAMKICDAGGVNASLDIYGPGDTALLRDCSRNVRYMGIIPFGEAQGVIAGYDLLLLPSRHDGWGVVVNEAILQGVPVIASTGAGSSALVEKSGVGCVFRSEDAGELASRVSGISSDPVILEKWKRNAIKFRELLEPEVAASYLHECLVYALSGRGSRPACPWYDLHRRASPRTGTCVT